MTAKTEKAKKAEKGKKTEKEKKTESAKAEEKTKNTARTKKTEEAAAAKNTARAKKTEEAAAPGNTARAKKTEEAAAPGNTAREGKTEETEEAVRGERDLTRDDIIRRYLEIYRRCMTEDPKSFDARGAAHALEQISKLLGLTVSAKDTDGNEIVLTLSEEADALGQ